MSLCNCIVCDFLGEALQGNMFIIKLGKKVRMKHTKKWMMLQA